MKDNYTTTATGTEKPGRVVQFRKQIRGSAEAAFLAVGEAHDNPLTRRKRTRALGHPVPQPKAKAGGGWRLKRK